MNKKESDIIIELASDLAKEFLKDCEGTIVGAHLSHPKCGGYATMFGSFLFSLLATDRELKEKLTKDFVMEIFSNTVDAYINARDHDHKGND